MLASLQRNCLLNHEDLLGKMHLISSMLKKLNKEKKCFNFVTWVVNTGHKFTCNKLYMCILFLERDLNLTHWSQCTQLVMMILFGSRVIKKNTQLKLKCLFSGTCILRSYYFWVTEYLLSKNLFDITFYCTALMFFIDLFIFFWRKSNQQFQGPAFYILLSLPFRFFALHLLW